MIPDNFPLIPALVLVCVAAFFSATETAFFSLSRFQLRQLKARNPARFEKVRFLLDRPAAFVATILLGNELSNVLISNLIAGYYEGLQISPLFVTILNLVTVMPIIMIVGEITPKILAARANVTVANFVANPLWWFYRVSFPIRFILETIVNVVTRPFRRRIPIASDQIKEEDIRILLDEGKRKGAIHSIERDMIENVFEIDDDSVIELATPLRDCFTVHQNESVSHVIGRLRNLGPQSFYARIPVRGDTIDRVVGVLYAKDLLNHIHRDEATTKVKHLMKEHLVVSPAMKVEVLFRRFRQNKRHIAIIQDKGGRALGVLTMEDILESMFGELWEEK